MELISTERTHKSPSVFCDSDNGLIEIRGRSILENSAQFYEPVVIHWLDQYLKSPCELTTVNIALEYYNTSSQMWIFQLLKRLTVLIENGKRLIINWYYFDEDIRDAGENIQNILKTKFNIIEANLVNV